MTQRTLNHDDPIISAAMERGRERYFEEGHAAHVAFLALAIFDQMRELHGLGGKERKLLAASAILHDIGCSISYSRHHKHSLAIISGLTLPGFSAADMLTAANIARYHRKNGPQQKHEMFKALSADDQDRVTKLAAILRIADALDRQHAEKVKGVDVQVLGDEVIITLRGDGGFSVERWAVERKCGLFGECYGRDLTIRDGEGN